MASRIPFHAWLIVGGWVVIATPALGQPENNHWCQTQEQWVRKFPPAEGGGCLIQGECDMPEVRDTWIPNPGTEVKILRMRFVVFAEDDGSNPTATQADVDAQMEHFNLDILSSGFQFVAETVFVNSTEFRYYTIDEDAAMKATYAVAPASQINVYVVGTGGFSFGTFPWDPSTLTVMGGIVLNEDHLGPGMSVLTHEVGHNLGLWHTHHGVSEVGLCSACYERADGLDGDTTGDFARDTPPSPVNFTCGPPGNNDVCSGAPWGETDFRNFMGYAPDACINHFTDHQKGRWRCWFDAVLRGWECLECSASGACCREVGLGEFACTDVLASDCDGTFVGVGTRCDELGASVDRCDCDGNGTVGVGRVFGNDVFVC